MDTNLILSLIANILLLAIQTWALCGIRNKRYIFKYYTYLQNFIPILVSTFFVIAVAADCMNVSRLLTAAKGFRYVATCGLVVTMFVFTFLSITCREDKNRIGSSDCKPGYSYRLVNIVSVSYTHLDVYKRQGLAGTAVLTGLDLDGMKRAVIAVSAMVGTAGNAATNIRVRFVLAHKKDLLAMLCR